ncbi:MAG: hypothetical protein FJ011_08375 [Chloroflexi bacterium]|nr:hypothetical protein [Chloroflexota bacterium]
MRVVGIEGWIVACLCLALLPASARAAAIQAPNPAPQLPSSARAFPAPADGATVWLTPGPEPALWLAAAGAAPRPVLRGQSEHFSVPRWSPDGRQVALFAAPTGTETALFGRWWMIDVDSPASPALLAQRPDWLNAEARVSEPFLPPSAFVTPAPSPRLLLPPAAIRVAHHPDNSCRDLPAWAVTVIPFEEYVARVLPAEVYTTWPAATLHAQAIAARTFAWRKIVLASPTASYDVTDWVVDQVMCDKRYASTDAAAAATASRYLAFNGEIIVAQYGADGGHPTADGGLPYLQPVLDPVSLGRPRSGHGRGLSQWGAYRWAAWRGWNTVQILAHYYRGAQVVDPIAGAASLSLLTPWPGTWLTGSTAYVTAHASVAATATLTMTLQAPGFRAAAEFGNLPGVWTAAWPLPVALTRPVTVTASYAALTHTLTLAGEDRLSPTGQFTVPAASTSITVTLYVTATDSGPSGPAGVVAGGDWQARAADFTRQAGQGSLVADPHAWSGQALVIPAGGASRWTAAFTQTLVANQIYQAYARLRAASTTGASADVLAGPASLQRIARLELFDSATNALLSFADLRTGDFRAAGEYQEFTLDFWLAPTAAGRVGARLIVDGGAEVTLDRVRVLKGPAPYSGEVAYRAMRTAGPQPVVVKILDAAGNPSVEVTGVTQLVDTAPPTAWQIITPTGWVTTTVAATIVARTLDELTGVAADSGQGRISLDGGLTWSAWRPVSGTIWGDGGAELRLTWLGLQEGEGQRVQLRAADRAGLTSASPEWPVRVDATPPTVRSALAALPNASGWFTAPITVALSAEDATSGVAGIWYAAELTTWTGRCSDCAIASAPTRFPTQDHTSSNLQPPTSNLQLPTSNLQPPASNPVWLPYTIPVAFTGEGSWRVLHRARDRAGLHSAVGEIAVRVDTAPPTTTLTAPDSVSPGTPFTVTWAGFDGIGVASYDVQLSYGMGGWLNTLLATSATQARFTAPTSGVLRLRARARDLAGNVGDWSAEQRVSVVGRYVYVPLVR